MRIKDLQHIFHIELDEFYVKEEIDNFFFILTERFYQVNRLQLALNPRLSITKAEQEPIFKALDELVNMKPIQYIIGETEFYGLLFKVDNFVLIPRPETEELVHWIIEENQSKSTTKILDIGTGSGCIAISLAKNLPNVEVFAIDVSEKALDIAKTNAELNEVYVEFYNRNILDDNIEVDGLKFDVIVSNPPYVRVKEKGKMRDNVLNHEPHVALFVEDDDALLFYKKIIKYAKSNLNENGQIFFEINEYLGEEMRSLLNNSEFKEIILKKDMFNKDRMIKAHI